MRGRESDISTERPKATPTNAYQARVTYPAVAAEAFLVGGTARAGARSRGEGSRRGGLLVPDYRRPRDALHGGPQPLLVLRFLIRVTKTK